MICNIGTCENIHVVIDFETGKMLAGMFTIITGLVILDKASPQKAEELVRWFDPAILWIQRWLGAFYVPSLAVLPLTIHGIAGKRLTSYSQPCMAMPLQAVC